MIALTESHLKSYVLDAEIQIRGYQIYRADRRDEINKGGVIIYVRDDFSTGSGVLSQGCNGAVEWMCLYLPTIKSVIVNVYRPPTCEESLFQCVLSQISDAIDSIGSPMPSIIVFGDFNMPYIDWSSGCVSRT